MTGETVTQRGKLLGKFSDYSGERFVELQSLMPRFVAHILIHTPREPNSHVDTESWRPGVISRVSRFAQPSGRHSRLQAEQLLRDLLHDWVARDRFRDRQALGQGR